MDWLGRASTTFTHSTKPLMVETRDGKEVPFSNICKEATPPCWLNPLLFNGHLQTMWTAVATQAPMVYYRRKIFDADHKTYTGSFAVDFVTPPHDDADPSLPPRTAYFTPEQFAEIGSDDNHPMLIVMHGLSGGSHEVYLRHAIAPLVLGNNNWEACVVTSRGCSNSEVTSGLLFNARATWDVRQVVKWATRTFPNRPLFGIGFSLGANILTNYIGEEGDQCLLKAAIVVGNPFNLQQSNKAMQRSFFSREVYLKVLGESMKRLIFQHKEAVLKYTKLDLERVRKVKYLYEFDREVQCVMWAYPTEEAYYRDASSSDSVLAVRIPFFAISARDDPIAVGEAIPYEEFKQNPYTVLCVTSLGGHLSWFEIGGGRWYTRPIKNLLTSLASQVNLDKLKPTSKIVDWPRGHVLSEFDPMRRKLTIL